MASNPDKPGRSRHFTICILAVSTTTRNRTVASAVKKTLARKLNPKGKRRRMVKEIKARGQSVVCSPRKPHRPRHPGTGGLRRPREY